MEDNITDGNDELAAQIRADFSAQIQAARAAKGLARAQVARAMGRPNCCLISIEKARDASYVQTLYRYARAVNAPIPAIGFTPFAELRLPRNLAAWRTRKRLSLREVAIRAFGNGNRHTQISAAENGGEFALEGAIRVAHVLGITLPELLFGLPPETP